MRQRCVGGAVLAVAVALLGPSVGRAQMGFGVTGAGLSGGEDGGFLPSGNTYPTIPIPTGQAGAAGFYVAPEFVILTQTRTLGDQTVAFRGLLDSSGRITGQPGIYLGSGQPAFSTDQLGRSSFQPGFQIEVGYRFEDGTRLFFNYLHLAEESYNTGASLATPFARSRADLSDTYLVSGVFNFPPQFSGPRFKTAYDVRPGGTLLFQTFPFFQNINQDPGFNTYGIWNGASVMNIKYTQRYNQAEAGARIPLFQTDYSRVYGLAGGKFAWFFERFQWYTLSVDINGNAGPQDQAFYTNTLSQRLYGPFVGCGHEIFLKNQFSLSLDLTAAGLVGVVKERTKYKLGDVPNTHSSIQPVTSKYSRNDWEFVPNVNANLNLWWYPIEGVQMRVGYQGMSYFLTRRMGEPIGFDYAHPEPKYGTQVFRILHGLNVGFGLFF